MKDIIQISSNIEEERKEIIAEALHYAKNWFVACNPDFIAVKVFEMYRDKNITMQECNKIAVESLIKQ